jgi:UDP-galactopyranose mutase
MHPDEKRHVNGTVLTHETPFTPENANQYEYPFPDKINKQLYEEYRLEAELLKNILICGRLGEYRYYDMDQAIGRAMMLASVILEKHKIPAIEYA